jgi:hypothetical protein
MEQVVIDAAALAFPPWVCANTRCGCPCEPPWNVCRLGAPPPWDGPGIEFNLCVDCLEILDCGGLGRLVVLGLQGA